MTRERSRTLYVCQECGASSLRWEGRCPQCGQWNALVETTRSTDSRRERWLGASASASQVQELADVQSDRQPRLATSLGELDRVLGGGIVPGSLALMAGDPGIGKSTLMLQASGRLAQRGARVLYVSGEESPQQVKMRAERLGIEGRDIFFLAETDVDAVLERLEAVQPSLALVDSVQTLVSQEVPSVAGSVGQVRECTRRLMAWAKEHSVPFLLAGHVTKDGSIAGPRVLEHMVDVVVSLEGDTLSPYRLLRGVKNRFGSTNEVGIFQMGGGGMEEVEDPSLLFLSERGEATPGAAIVATLEGTRPLLAEIQALTTPSVFPQPRRTATGVDFQRLILISAVVSRRLGLPLGGQDIIVNVAGGLHLQEPAADLGMALALVSCFRDVPCPPSMVVVGEIGLGGEVRRVPQLERRLAEAARLGFRQAVVPAAQREDAAHLSLTVLGAATVGEAVRLALPRARRRGEAPSTAAGDAGTGG